MKTVVTYLDEELYHEFKTDLGDVKVATGVRRLITDFVQKCRDREEKR